MPGWRRAIRSANPGTSLLTEISPCHFWDANYAIVGYKYGLQPNAFLVEQAPYLPTAAQILLPGDGEGRNGVWLARQGHIVTSIDCSAVGLAKALGLAMKHGVVMRTRHLDLANWSPTPASADAVILTYVHLPPVLRRTVHRQAAQALKPGGRLILEAFNPDQLGRSSGGPQDASLLYRLENLREDFAGCLDEILGWEGEVELNEGSGHQGPAHITRWVGIAA